MSWRAVILGLLAGLAIASLTFFNDIVMGQTRLIGSGFPISVFGGAALLVLIVNPLLRLLGSRVAFRPGEIAVAVAIALAACSMPGQGFFQYWVTTVGLPPHQQQSNPSWHANGMLSYLPGGSHAVALGHVQDWRALATAVTDERDADTPPGRLWRGSYEPERRLWEAARAAERLNPSDAQTLLRAVNRVLASEALLPALPADTPVRERVAAGRAALVEALPGAVMPAPPGEGAVLNGGFPDDRYTPPVVLGLRTGRLLPVDEVPWAAWWPSIRTWGLAALCLTLAALCLAIILHPQWAVRELLTFPIPRVFGFLTRRTGEGGLPDIARSQLFWMGALAMVLMHLVNGLHAWFPAVPTIPRSVNLDALHDLFPSMARTPMSFGVFAPTFYPSAVAFAFFVNRTVSLSFGLTPLIFAAIAGLFLSRGVTLADDHARPTDMVFLRLGAHLVILATILWGGRRYYLDLVKGGVGLRAGATATPTTIWAARGFVVLTVLAIVALGQSGLSPLMAALFVGLMLMMWVVAARVVCEAGLFLMEGPFMAVAVLPGLFGDVAVGPTQMLLLGLIGFIMMGDIKEALLPAALTGLEAARRTGEEPRRVAKPMLAMVPLAFAVATVATLGFIYENGISGNPNAGASIGGPTNIFNRTVESTAELTALDRIREATAMTDAGRLVSAEPDPRALTFLAVGVGLTLLCAVARLRLTWWPLHPLIFVIIGTWGIAIMGWSFLMGWAIATAVTRLGGLRAHHAAAPLMVGVIAGELVAGLGWMIVGWLYYLLTGLRPASYMIFAA